MVLKKKNTIIFIILIFFNLKLIFSQEIMLENFDQNNSVKWKFISDQVMGGVSYGKSTFLSGNDISFVRLTGFVSLENNGGFIQIRKKIENENMKNIKGFKLRLRGNESTYYLHIRTHFTLLPWQYYQAKMIAKENWTDVFLDLRDFVRSGIMLPKNINPNNIKSIAVVAFGREHKVRLDIDKILLY